MDEDFAFKAVFGNTTIRGYAFVGVADALIERGFDITNAKQVGEALVVPHTLPRRRPAKIYRVNPQVPEPPVFSDEVEQQCKAAAEAYVAVYSGQVVPGIQTRPCGAVHSDGVVCLIPVLFESLHCGCGDMSFPHEQPHEAVDEEGVRYRWEEILVIQDLEYDSYRSNEVSA